MTGAKDSQQTMEGLLGGNWRVYRFSEPEISLTTSVALYPSFSQSGRYRGNFDTSLQYEFIKDFILELSVYYDYDSEPPGLDPQKDDYGVTTSLGYKF